MPSDAGYENTPSGMSMEIVSWLGREWICFWKPLETVFPTRPFPTVACDFPGHLRRWTAKMKWTVKLMESFFC